MENQEIVEAPKAKRGKGRSVLMGVLVLLAVPQLVSRSVDLTGSVINGGICSYRDLWLCQFDNQP